MLKRIIHLEKNNKTKRNIIKYISEPLEENAITKSQIQIQDYRIVDAEKINNIISKTPKNFGKTYNYFWNEETQSIEIEETDLPFEQMSLEQKVNFLYMTFIKSTLLLDKETEEETEETDE